MEWEISGFRTPYGLTFFLISYHRSLRAFLYFILSILTMESQELHLSVTNGPSRITLNSLPPQGWGFLSFTICAVNEFDD